MVVIRINENDLDCSDVFGDNHVDIFSIVGLSIGKNIVNFVLPHIIVGNDIDIPIHFYQLKLLNKIYLRVRLTNYSSNVSKFFVWSKGTEKAALIRDPNEIKCLEDIYNIGTFSP